MNKNINIVSQIAIIKSLIEDKTVALMATTKLSLDNELYSFMLEASDSCSGDKEIQGRLKQLAAVAATGDIVYQIVKKYLSELLNPPKATVAVDANTQRPVELKDKTIIEYVCIRIISRDDKTFYSEYSLHQPNRHEHLKDKIKNLTGKKPGQLGDVEEGFKTDEGKFLSRREAMDIYRAGNLCNRVDLKYGKPDDTEMQSIYLW